MSPFYCFVPVLYSFLKTFEKKLKNNNLRFINFNYYTKVFKKVFKTGTNVQNGDKTINLGYLTTLLAIYVIIICNYYMCLF